MNSKTTFLSPMKMICYKIVHLELQPATRKQIQTTRLLLLKQRTHSLTSLQYCQQNAPVTKQTIQHANDQNGPCFLNYNIVQTSKSAVSSLGSNLESPLCPLAAVNFSAATVEITDLHGSRTRKLNRSISKYIYLTYETAEVVGLALIGLT